MKESLLTLLLSHYREGTKTENFWLVNVSLNLKNRERKTAERESKKERGGEMKGREEIEEFLLASLLSHCYEERGYCWLVNAMVLTGQRPPMT